MTAYQEYKEFAWLIFGLPVLVAAACGLWMAADHAIEEWRRKQ